MNNYRFILLFSLIIGSLQVQGQQYFFRRYYSEEGGLPQSQVRDVIQDKRGSLWVATDGGGIARFNGKNFTLFTNKQGLPYNQVSGLLQDRNDNIWYASYRGIGYYNGYTYTNIPAGRWFNDCHFAKLYEDETGRIWVYIYYTAERSRLVCVQNGKIVDSSQEFPELALVKLQSNSLKSAVFQASDKSLFIQTYQGLYHLQKDKLSKSILNSIPLLQKQHLMPVLSDFKGKLWVRTAENAADTSNFHLYTWQNQKLTEILLPDTLRQYPATNLLEDHQGTIYLGLKNKGLLKYQNQKFTPYFQKGSIANFTNNINKLLLDQEKNIWMGTEGGLIRFGGESFSWYNALDGLPSEVVSSIYQDSKKRTWFAMGTGAIAYLEDGKINAVPLPEKIKPGRTRGIIELPTGEILFASNAGIWRYQNNLVDEVSNRYDLPAATSTSSFLLTGNTLWIGSLGEGVIRVTGSEIRHFTTKNGLTSNYIRKIQQDRSGTIWFCTDEGISFLSPANQQTGEFSHIPQFKGRAFQMAQDKTGQLWFATYGEGLVRVKNQKVSFFTAANGLSSDNLYSILSDGNHNILVGTQQHLDKIELAPNGEPIRVTNYGMLEGFVGTENNGGAAYRDPEGKLWFGTLRGAIMFNPQLEKRPVILPKTYIIQIQLFYRNVNWLAQPYRKFTSGLKAWNLIPEGLTLPYKQNHIAFTFESSTLRKPEKVQYSWFLDDIDREWSPPSPATQAIYPDLPPGHYTFLVKSSDGEGNWSKEPAQYRFTIRTPYWRTWWFLAALGLLILILLVFAVRYLTTRKLRNQLRQLEIEQKIHKERERIARDLHDNVGSQLAYIINSLDNTVASNKIIAPEKSAHLQDFTKNTINQLRETIWAIRKENISVGELAARIEKFGWQLTQFQKSVKFEVKTAGPQDWKLSPVQALNLFRIAQEAISNAVKHSQATILLINLEVILPQTLRLTITDNGLGFHLNQDLPADHYGLTNMQERAKEIPATLNLNSEIGKGTTILLEADLNQNAPDFGLGKFITT